MRTEDEKSQSSEGAVSFMDTTITSEEKKMYVFMIGVVD
jgi:hypothetical protein